MDLRSGYQQIVIHLEGRDVSRMRREAGNHRLQRVPPTERRGRVHTSTVTVAVFEGDGPQATGGFDRRSPDDFRVEWFNGTVKAGGQHHQKNATCCRVVHLPTGLVRTAQTRSRRNSEQMAFAAMNAELDRLANEARHRIRNDVRRSQTGNGERCGERRRAWRFQADEVIDYVTGKSARASDVIRGDFRRLW